MIEHLDDFTNHIREMAAEFDALCAHFQSCDMDFLGYWTITEATLKLYDALDKYIKILEELKVNS